LRLVVVWGVDLGFVLASLSVAARDQQSFQNEPICQSGQFMKSTDKQIAANRRNAAHSTGPRTESGKAIACRNSLKHGLLAKEIVIDAGEGAESQAEFNAVLSDLHAQFEPQGPLEEMLIEKIAVAYWRLRRAHRYEVGLIRENLDNACDEYYAPDRFEPSATKTPDDQIDAQIGEARELRQSWQADRDEFTKMRPAGKDLQEIYEWASNWDWLFDVASETVDDISSESPATIRASLNKAGWTDDAIWQAHIDICAEQMQAQDQAIRQLEDQKRKNHLALQVRHKVGCVPDSRDLDRLLKYEGSIERQFYKAVDQLERLQRLRAGDPVPAPVNVDLAINTGDTV